MVIKFPAPSDESANPFPLFVPYYSMVACLFLLLDRQTVEVVLQSLSRLANDCCTSQITQKTTLERFGKLLTVISYIGLIVLTHDTVNLVFSCTERQVVRRTPVLALSFSRKVWHCGGNFIYAVYRSADVFGKSRFQDIENVDEFLNGSATHIVNSTTFWSTTYILRS